MYPVKVDDLQSLGV